MEAVQTKIVHNLPDQCEARRSYSGGEDKIVHANYPANVRSDGAWSSESHSAESTVKMEDRSKDSAGVMEGGKVLIVGNSLSYYNGGIRTMLRSLDPSWQTEHIVRPGASLRTLWKDGRPLKRMQKGELRAVVLQEDLPETTVAAFGEAAPLFVAAARESGATPILLMAWPYERLSRTSLDTIIVSHARIAASLGVQVAPAGIAFDVAGRCSAELATSLPLLAPDQEHPTVAGTYLAALCVGAALEAERRPHCPRNPHASHAAARPTAVPGGDRVLTLWPAGGPTWWPPTIHEAEAQWLWRIAALARAEWEDDRSSWPGP